ncbi:MAG: hypothetical protein ACI35S_00120 [Anaeroplasma sp.]
MIQRNKNLIVGLTIYILITFLLPIPFIIIFDRSDILGISCIISCLLLLLFINLRASGKLKNDYKKKYYKEGKSIDNFKESQRILWLTFIVLVIITIIVCIVL